VFRVWRMAPWVRAPFLLLRRAGVAGAVIAASFVATLPAAAAAPFLSSSTNATLHSQIRASCPSNVGDLITYDLHAYSPEDFTSPWPLVDNPPSVPEALGGDEAIEHRIAGVAASGAGLAAPEIAWHATNAKVQVSAQLAKVTSMTIPDFADHVHVVSGPNGDGAWIPDGFASAYHLAVGEPLVYKSNYGPPTKVRIVAIYRDIRSEPPNPAFCGMQLLIFGPRGALLFGDDTQNAIPPVILMDRKTFATGVIPYRAKGVMMFPLADPKVPINETPPVMSTIKKVDAAVGPAFRDCPRCESTTHRSALLVELALPLGAGLGIGLALALGFTYAFSAGFDVDPSLPPKTLITLPFAVITGIAAAVVVVTLLSSGFAQLRVARANPAEVLRDTV
jgi:putative ABC transport system permease protein